MKKENENENEKGKRKKKKLSLGPNHKILNFAKNMYINILTHCSDIKGQQNDHDRKLTLHLNINITITITINK
jgi:hypothetical protein